MKKALIIAYVFPPLPFAGTYRTLRFCKYLGERDWQPVVLTIREQRGMPRDDTLMDAVPEGIRVYRTPTIDPYRTYLSLLAWVLGRLNRGPTTGGNPARDGASDPRGPEPDESRNKGPEPGGPKRKILSILGRLQDRVLELFATPDHMVFWIPFAIIGGIRAILKEKIDVIYTSGPPHSSHLIGLALSRLLRKPWIADFRDPWIDSAGIKMIWRSRGRRWIDGACERAVVRGADRVLVSSKSNRWTLVGRFAEICDTQKIVTLTNGYDPGEFRDRPGPEGSTFEILHVGTFYLFQTPEPFLKGLQKWLESASEGDRARMRVTLAGGREDSIERIIGKLGLEASVRQIDRVAHSEAVGLMCRAHLLLLILGFDETTRGILPSKTFEYLAAGRPILAVVPEGETASVIRDTNTGIVISDESPEAVAAGIEQAFRMVVNGQFRPNAETIAQYDGRVLTGRLADIMDHISREKPAVSRAPEPPEPDEGLSEKP